MRYCERCKVNIAGRWERCPLCDGYLAPPVPREGLDTDGEEAEEIFPRIPTIYYQYGLFFRILIWVSVIAAAVSFAVNFAWPGHGLWSLIVAAGIGSFWALMIFAVRKRRDLSKSILYQLLIASILVVIWDCFMGWHRWSIDYVIPILCVSGMLSMGILSRVMKQYINDPILYLSIYGALGFIPLIPLVFGWLNVIYPSLICVVISVISLSGILLFRGRQMKQELKKRMHV